jgi:hypothetical protein
MSRRPLGLSRVRLFACLRKLRIKFAIADCGDQGDTDGNLSSDDTAIAGLPFSNSIVLSPLRTNNALLPFGRRRHHRGTRFPAVERAGLSSLNEGQVIEYEVVANKGKTSAENLKVQR